MKKKLYDTPDFFIERIDLEQSIAVGSATINPMATDESNNIQVEGWQDGGSVNKSDGFEL